MIHFMCPSCRNGLKVADEAAGRKVACPKCGQRLLIPRPAAPTGREKTVLGSLLSPPGKSAPAVNMKAGDAINVACPGCGRTIRLLPNELSLSVECARCATRFVPAREAGLTPSAAAGQATSGFARPSNEEDRLAVVGLAKDAESGEGGGGQTGKPPRSWVGVSFAVLALLLAVVAMPAAVIHHALLGAGLAGLGVFLGGSSLLIAIKRGGAGCGLSLGGTAVCGSVLFAAIILLDKDTAPDDRRAEKHEGEAARHPVDESGRGEDQAGRDGRGEPAANEEGKSSASGALRLSGIRQQQFLGGPYSSGDLDLWKTNPVEADAKWKGKKVEVEMDLSYLEIKTGEDGLAFLLTEDNEYWRAAGVQHAAFVFWEKSRSQLVGLHEKGGIIIIRGRCLGLSRRRVFFEDCKIVRKPAPPRETRRDREDTEVHPPARAELERIIQQLKSESADGRIAAAQRLGEMGEKARPAARALCEAAVGPKESARSAATEALEKVDPTLYKQVLVLLVDEIASNHVQASAALGAMGAEGAAAVPVLLEHARKHNTNTGEYANLLIADIEALAKLAPGEPEVVKLFLDIIKLRGVGNLQLEASLHQAAINALVETGKAQPGRRKEFVPVFLAAMELANNFAPRDVETCLVVLKALGEFGADSKAAIPTLRKSKLDSSMTIRDAARAALEKIEKDAG